MSASDTTPQMTVGQRNRTAFMTIVRREVSRILRRLRTEATIEQGGGEQYVPSTEPAAPIPQSPPGEDDL